MVETATQTAPIRTGAVDSSTAKINFMQKIEQFMQNVPSDIASDEAAIEAWFKKEYVKS